MLLGNWGVICVKFCKGHPMRTSEVVCEAYHDGTFIHQMSLDFCQFKCISDFVAELAVLSKALNQI